MVGVTVENGISLFVCLSFRAKTLMVLTFFTGQTLDLASLIEAPELLWF